MSVKRYQPVAQCVEPSYQAQMIEPKVMEFSEGEYVRWEDYDATCETLAHTETERDASDAEVQRLKAEVERLRKAGEWRPIETAPKDGTEVLLFSSSEFYYVGKYCYEKDGETVWACGSFMLHGPTHWMPIPKPPCV